MNNEYEEFLNKPLAEDDYDTGYTVRTFLKMSFLELVSQWEGFSGKRPLGNSCDPSIFEGMCDKNNIDPRALVAYMIK